MLGTSVAHYATVLTRGLFRRWKTAGPPMGGATRRATLALRHVLMLLPEHYSFIVFLLLSIDNSRAILLLFWCTSDAHEASVLKSGRPYAVWHFNCALDTHQQLRYAPGFASTTRHAPQPDKGWAYSSFRCICVLFVPEPASCESVCLLMLWWIIAWAWDT